MKRLCGLLIILLALDVPVFAQSGFADFRSEPSGAQVFVDDSLRGVTPLLVNLRVGSHRVLFRSENGGSVLLQITIAENEVTTHEVTIAPRHRLSAASQGDSDGGLGKITVITDQPGAEITIDGRPTGARTPVTIDEVPTGRHLVRASAYLDRLRDTFSVTETVHVRSGRSSLIRINYTTHTTESTLRLESNDPQLSLTLRHVDSDKRYTLRRVGDVRLVTGTYAVESGLDSIGVPTLGSIRVVEDSVTMLFVPHYTRLLPLKRLEEHPSYVDVETFVRRSHRPRPLSETRSDLYVSQNFAWWLGGGVAMVLAGEIMRSEESIGRSSGGALNEDRLETARILRGAGFASLVAGALLTSRIDTVLVDLSFNQQANKREEDFLRARHKDLIGTWQYQIDRENQSITSENQKRRGANAALPPPSVSLGKR